MTLKSIDAIEYLVIFINIYFIIHFIQLILYVKSVLISMNCVYIAVITIRMFECRELLEFHAIQAEIVNIVNTTT